MKVKKKNQKKRAAQHVGGSYRFRPSDVVEEWKYRIISADEMRAGLAGFIFTFSTRFFCKGSLSLSLFVLLRKWKVTGQLVNISWVKVWNAVSQYCRSLEARQMFHWNLLLVFAEIFNINLPFTSAKYLHTGGRARRFLFIIIIIFLIFNPSTGQWKKRDKIIKNK